MPLGYPQGVAVDAAGNVYAADHGNCIVVKISPAGVLTIVAGNGRCGFSGDGGPATQAMLRLNPFSPESDPLYLHLPPAGLAVDASGSLYIADAGNHRVRKVTPDSIIRTVAGTGQTTEVRDSVPATSSSLFRPHDVALGPAGTIYIASGGRVRRVSPDGIISTIYTSISDPPDPVHPTRSRTIRAPIAVEVDAPGNVYAVEVSYQTLGADRGAARILRLESDGRATLVAGGGFQSGDDGPANQASLGYVSGIAFDRMGNLYIADQSNQRVRKVGRDGNIST
ncbi:MAG: RICIN domain-containing protein, partial [Gammaproteobacteria bacterium]